MVSDPYEISRLIHQAESEVSTQIARRREVVLNTPLPAGFCWEETSQPTTFDYRDRTQFGVDVRWTAVRVDSWGKAGATRYLPREIVDT